MAVLKEILLVAAKQFETWMEVQLPADKQLYTFGSKDSDGSVKGQVK